VIYLALDDLAAKAKERFARRTRPALPPPEAEPEASS
jgi:hypothetical protein